MIFSDSIFNENNNIVYYFHKDGPWLVKKTMTSISAHIEVWDPINEQVLEEHDLDESGRMHGLFLQHYPSGKLRKRVIFDHGHIVKFHSWWENGRPKKVFHESEENPDVDHYSEWWENGAMSRYLHFYHGEIEGFVNEWWDDGGLRSMSQYVGGLKEGIAIECEKKGRAAIRCYEGGVCVY